MDVLWSPIASKQLRKLPVSERVRVVEKMRFWSAQDDPFKFAEPLVGRRPPEFRFRVGSYRIIVGRNEQLLTVLRVADRKDVYQ